VREYLRTIGKKYGSGEKAAKNMTAEERSARAKKASMAAAMKRRPSGSRGGRLET
jgi:hypothetical protein